MINFVRESSNQEKLFDSYRHQKIIMIKHTIILIFIVESIVIMTYYQMYTPNKKEYQKLWISFFYSCQGNNCFLNRNICQYISYEKEYYQSYCYDNSMMNIIRYVLSSILIFIILLMFFDIYRIFKIKKELNVQIMSFDLIQQAKKYQILIILLLFVYYAILLIFIFCIDGEYGSALGFSFYVGSSGTIIYIIILAYNCYVEGRFTRTTYFEKMLKQQLTKSEIEHSYEFKTVENRGESFYSAKE
ncbi:unnamed protein product [Paramecium sonneborni]|uniref:Transmembrane protein n=1 Tax=Paramecium sonneborni TaxID=65129 RepID=A0A8S1REB9_9CILI|nr:unnamed protein product [Paramecium sonneborni]